MLAKARKARGDNRMRAGVRPDGGGSHAMRKPRRSVIVKHDRAATPNWGTGHPDPPQNREQVAAIDGLASRSDECLVSGEPPSCCVVLRPGQQPQFPERHATALGRLAHQAGKLDAHHEDLRERLEPQQVGA